MRKTNMLTVNHEMNEPLLLVLDGKILDGIPSPVIQTNGNIWRRHDLCSTLVEGVKWNLPFDGSKIQAMWSSEYRVFKSVVECMKRLGRCRKQ
jgi:hypothetical protein